MFGWNEWDTSKHYYWIPRCLHWVFIDFLWTVESLMIAVVDNSFLWKTSNLPRGVWLLYWLVILVVMFPLAPTTAPSSHHNNDDQHHHNHAILARKWFHLVAVLLFAPVTVLAPQLMCYAVLAVSGLPLLESMRHYVPWLHQFYHRYLDVRNKQE